MERRDRKYQGQFGIPFSKIHLDRELAYVVPLNYRLLLAVVGPKYSGKTVVTSHLVEDYGYRFYSLSAFVKEEVDRLCLPDERAVLKREGDRLRREFGREVLARKGIQSIRRDLVERREPITHMVVDGIKNAGEVEFLKRLPSVEVVGIVASDERRFERAKSLGFKGTLGDFRERVDVPDSNSTDDRGQQVQTCLGLVDLTIENDGTKLELFENVDRMLEQCGGIPT